MSENTTVADHMADLTRVVHGRQVSEFAWDTWDVTENAAFYDDGQNLCVVYLNPKVTPLWRGIAFTKDNPGDALDWFEFPDDDPAEVARRLENWVS